MPLIYLSPHLDDAVFSCGGLIWQQVQAGESVEIWTLCAGDPPDDIFSPFALELHLRWGGGAQAVALRRREDIAACRVVGAAARHFPVPDCIYRRAGLDYWDTPAAQMASVNTPPLFLYPDRDSIFNPIHPLEIDLVETVSARVAGCLAAGAQLIAPLAAGGHVDHRLTRLIAERLFSTVSYYPDYPYAAEHLDELENLAPPGVRRRSYALSPTALEFWARSIEAHQSQISSFWPGPAAMRSALKDYSRLLGGSTLWIPGKSETSGLNQA